MLFPTATFAIFFLLVLPLSWLLMPHVHRWRPFMIVASYVFYAWWDWRFVILLAGCTLWNQFLAVRIHRSSIASQRKWLLIVALSGNLLLLGYFKYYDFFVSLDAERSHDRRLRPAVLRQDDRPAGRDLLLHLHGDQLRRRHVPRRLRADDAREVRRLPVVLPTPRGRADRPARRADPAARHATRIRGASTRAAPSISSPRASSRRW